MTGETWNEYAKRLVKSEMLKKDIKSVDLVALLNKIGIKETKSSISSKISRGTFSAAFLFQVLQVMGCKKLVIIPPEELNLKTGNTMQTSLPLFKNVKNVKSKI